MILLFIIGLIFGYLAMYLFAPEKKIIIKYPTLQNIGKVTYVDGNGVHYKYKKVPL